ncbi:MAG TPA: efflux transporter outer membrane subunit [Accumulibacter sp.]|nr:efflux transporter outer membrane subunit [Accumulibacter sp.]HQC81110.1 efflux transporter outer membrane subunit [Accumulibacter sp.]
MHKPIVVGLVALLATACQVGPDYVRPSVDTPIAWRLSESTARNLANVAWWEQFGDPVLDELIVDALRENKDLRIASARVDEFAARHAQTRSALFPQASAGFEASRQRSSVAGEAGSYTFNNYQATFGASWEIDLWGRLRRQNEAARAQLLGSEEGRRGVILSLASQVAGGYIGLLNLDRQLAIAQATAETRRQSYEVFKERHAGGVISILELSQNRSQYEEALATMPGIEKAIAQQENALSLLLGRNPGPIRRGKSVDQLTLPSIPPALPSELLERRPDILQAEQVLIAAHAQIGVAKAAYFPRISLTGLFGYVSPALGRLFDNSGQIWQTAAPIGLPIFTAGAIDSQIKSAEATRRQALFAYQQTIQQSFREVNDALVDRRRSGEQRQAQQRQIEALRQYTAAAHLRYDNGYSSYIDVLDAQRSLFNAELQYTQTLRGQLQATIDLYKAIGGGWSVETAAGADAMRAP